MSKTEIESIPKVSKRRRLKRLKRNEILPVFESLLTPAIPNSLDELDYPGDLEGDATAEVSVVLKTILAERKQLRDQYRLRGDTEYFVCLCFQSREQKLDFLEKVGWLAWGDKYLDGLRCAADLGIDLEAITLPRVKTELRTPKKLRKEVLPHETPG